MALKGTLRDFPVSDIFQLIGHQQKSGSLFIKNNDKQARIIFDDGKVILCTFLESDDDLLLGNMLVKAKAISREQLQEAVLLQKTNGRSIGDTLVQLKHLSPKTLSEFIKLQIDEVLFRIFQWEDGFYEFISEKIKFNKNVIEAQNAEAVLMESFRKKDEWPSIVKIIGDFSQKYQAAANATAHIVGETEAKVVSLLDGNRSVQEVIELSRLGTFECSKIVSALIQKNVLKKNASPTTTMEHSLSWFSWALMNKTPVLAALSLAILTPVATLRAPQELSPLSQGRSLKAFARINGFKRLEERLKIYHLEHGQYPDSIEDLVTSDPTRHTLIYEKRQNGYSLELKWSE